MRWTYVLLLISGVVCTHAGISVKKAMYVEASVDDKDAISKAGLSNILSELKKVACLPGEECQDTKSGQETTYRPYYYTTRRPWDTTPYRPYYYTTGRPWDTTPYRPYYYTTRRPWDTTPYRPYYYTTRRPWDTTPYRPYYYTTRRPWDTTPYRPYDYTTRRPWDTTPYRPYDYTTPSYWKPSTYTPYDYTTRKWNSNDTTLHDYLTRRPQISSTLNDTTFNAPPNEREGEDLFDCSDLPPLSPSGVYNLSTWRGPVEVFCDMDTDGGNWTVIQSRNLSSSQTTNRTWEEYKYGFGKIKEAFWLGNRQISNMTMRRHYSLRVDTTSLTGARFFANYDTFGVLPEDEDYSLHVAGYSGNAGDGLAYHDRNPFSTYDMNNGEYYYRNCAAELGGGWWYRNCLLSDLNGNVPRWLNKKIADAEMKIRPAGHR